MTMTEVDGDASVGHESAALEAAARLFRGFGDPSRLTIQRRPGDVLDAPDECLDEHFSMEHCTFQLEPADHCPHEGAHHD